MAVLKKINKRRRDFLCRKFFYRTELSKVVLKSLLASPFFIFSDRFYFYKKFLRFDLKNSITFCYSSCFFTGFSKTVFRLFKLSRHQVKRFASNGHLMGMRKSSF